MAESKWPRWKNWLAALFYLAIGLTAVYWGVAEEGIDSVLWFVAAYGLLYFFFFFSKRALKDGQTSES